MAKRKSQDVQDYDPEPVTIDDGDLNDGENVLDIRVPLEGERDPNRRWYVVHCYSGHENKVKHAVLQRIQTMGMQDKIFDVLIPTAEEIEVKEGKQKKIEKRVFPGYILVEMIMDEDSWYVVGMGTEPTPLSEDEVKHIMRRMESEVPVVKVNFKVGQRVRIVSGPFNDIIGVVSDIYPDRNKVRVMVSFFGRETPVEVDFLEVEKV
jgi:transcription termination/antitermination protein NusG